jgi:hypothetical protein
MRKAKAKATKVNIGEIAEPKRKGLVTKLKESAATTTSAAPATATSSKTTSPSDHISAEKPKQTTPLPTIPELRIEKVASSSSKRPVKTSSAARYNRKDESVTVEITPAIFQQARKELESEGLFSSRRK